MRPGNDKRSAIMIIFSYAMLVLLLMIFVAPQTAQHVHAGAAPMVFFVAGLCTVMSLFWSMTRLPPRGPLPTPKRFQVDMLVAMAWAELMALLAIFLGAGQIGPWPFVILTWILILGFVLPRTLRYFRLYESGGGIDAGSTWSSS